MCIGGKCSTQINVIFDGGSPVSFLEESLAKSLDLKPLRKDVLSLEGICAVKHSQQKYNRYDVTLQSISDDKQYNLQVYGLNKICSVNHHVDVNLNKLLMKWGINIQNSQISENHIHLLIGGDFYWDFVTGKIIRTDFGIV